MPFNFLEIYIFRHECMSYQFLVREAHFVNISNEIEEKSVSEVCKT